MESSSQVFGGHAEECHSSESGWTMYIGSHIDGENDPHGHHSDDGENYGHHHHKDDSDDSMVSDASSAPTPSHHQGHGLRGKEERGKFEEEDEVAYCLDKKAKKPKEKQRAAGRRSKEAEKKEKKALVHGKKR